MKEKNKIEVNMVCGFIIEISLFMFTGFLAAYKMWAAIPAFILSILMALAVGKEIKKHGIITYQEENTIEIPLNKNDKRKKRSRRERRLERV